MTTLLIFAAVIGLLLGLLGGGGSVLTVPVLVYWVGMEPRTAMATSLVLVLATSLTAIISHARAGRVCWKTGGLFGTSGMLGAYLGGRLAAFIPGGVLLLIFAAIMLGTAIAMLRRRSLGGEDRQISGFCPRRLPLWAVLFDGFGVGAIAGLVGAGGGFLVVPALTLLGGLPMYAAIGTSLMVVAMQSSAALAGYITHITLDLHLTVLITLAAVSGSLFGGLFANRISQSHLRRGFGVFVLLVASYLLYRELSWGMLDQLHELILTHREFLLGMATVPTVMLLVWLRKTLNPKSRQNNHHRKHVVHRGHI